MEENDLALNLTPESGTQYFSMGTNAHTNPTDGIKKGI